MTVTLVKVHVVTGTLAANDASDTVNIGATLGDTAKSFVLFSYRNSNNRPDESLLTCAIVSTTQITVSRFVAGGAATPWRAYVCEFSVGVTVLRGSEDWGTATSRNIDISGTFAVEDLGNLAAFMYQQGAGSTYGGDDGFTFDIFDNAGSLNLRLQKNLTQNPDSNGVMKWEVVKYDDWSVTRGSDTGMASGDSSEVSSGLASVDTAKTFMICHARHGNITTGDIGEAMIRAVMDSSTQITFHRGDTGIAITDISWERMEFTGNETVQAVSEAFIATDGVETATLGTTLSGTDKAAAVGSFRGLGGSCDMTSDDVIGEAAFELDIASTTSLVTTRDATVSAADLEAYVIDFGGAVATIISASLDAQITKQDQLATLSVDAFLQKTLEVTASLDAHLQKSGLTLSTTLDANITLLGLTLQASLDALISSQITKTVNLDAHLQKVISLTTSLDAFLTLIGGTRTVSLDALLVKLGLTEVTNLDAVLQKGLTLSTGVDAVITKEGLTTPVSLDALIILLGKSLTTSLDAILNKQGLTSTTNLDAVLTGIVSVITAIDAVLVKAGIQISTNLDAVIARRNTVSTQLDAVIRGTRTLSASLDAILFGGVLKVRPLFCK